VTGAYEKLVDLGLVGNVTGSIVAAYLPPVGGKMDQEMTFTKLALICTKDRNFQSNA